MRQNVALTKSPAIKIAGLFVIQPVVVSTTG